MSRTGYVITYLNYPIILAIRLKTEIALSTTEVGYIYIYQYMRDVLPFVSLMKDIDYIEIKYHHFCSLVENGDVEIKYVDSKE